MSSCNVYVPLFVILGYYIVMDIIMFVDLQDITLTDQKRRGTFSLFHPMTIKLLMNDHTTNYFMVVSTEYFEIVTKFSKNLSFISPNMVTVLHFFVSLLAAKFMSSESLHERRKGVFLFEVKTWLDCFDGVIARNHNNDLVYKSHRESWGHFIDSISDVLGGIAISIGVLFFLFKTRMHNRSERDIVLPLNKQDIPESYVKRNNSSEITKKTIFWKCFCYGILIAIAAGSWDIRVEEMEQVLQIDLKNKQKTALQTSFLHSFTTGVVMYPWKLFCGQSLLQILMVVIFIDKVWEFLNFIQYIGYVVVVLLNVITVLYINHMKTAIGLK